MIKAAAAPRTADMYLAVLPGRIPKILPHNSKMSNVTVKLTAAEHLHRFSSYHLRAYHSFALLIVIPEVNRNGRSMGAYS